VSSDEYAKIVDAVVAKKESGGLEAGTVISASATRNGRAAPLTVCPSCTSPHFTSHRAWRRDTHMLAALLTAVYRHLPL